MHLKRLAFITILSLLAIYNINMKPASQKDKIEIYNTLTGEIELLEKISKTDAEWKKLLTPSQYNITRQKGTEHQFTGMCDVPKKSGIYKCISCGTDLFSVENKFESGTGWPSFWNPVSQLNIKTQPDHSLGTERIEVLCTRCSAHLGHVFNDGPPPTGKRYCINSIALQFLEADNKKLEKALFSAGCFWGVEESFCKLNGVIQTRVGYAGGRLENPTYEDVCTNRTGHAEAVEVIFDPIQISYKELLDRFWNIHDPTTINRQGPDIVTQYRSIIFYTSKDQEKTAKESKENLEKKGIYKNKITTEIIPAKKFYPAEEYHQKYLEKTRPDTTSERI